MVTHNHPQHGGAAHTAHRGNEVRVGRFRILAGGTQYMSTSDLAQADVLVPLTGAPELEFGRTYTLEPGSRLRGITPLDPERTYVVLAGMLQDYGGVPDNWGEFLKTQVIPLLKQKKRLLAFCIGSHGRTGTFIASLIALLEPRVKDPIAAARRRHCCHAVETRAQAQGVFALRGQPLPDKYARAFSR